MSSLDLFNALASVTRPATSVVDVLSSLTRADQAATSRRAQMVQALDSLRGGGSAQDTGSGGGSIAPVAVSGNVNQWISKALRDIGQSDSPQLHAAVAALVSHESGGNPRAVNNWDSNARAGHPSMGLAQTIMPTFQQYRDPRLPNNPFDPESDLVAGLRYGISHYGSIFNIPGIASLMHGGAYRGY
jgi:transglycosylase-like protein with SLT domain